MKRLPAYTPLAVMVFISLLAPNARGAAANPGPPAKLSGQSPAGTLSLPDDTLIFAKLAAQLDTKRSKPGDRLEVLITDDIKIDQETVLKKGSRIIGQIAELQATPPPGGVYGVGIVFDSVQTKTGETFPLRVIIRAVAPPPDQGTNPITDLPPGFDGHVSANLGAVEELNAQSEGALHLPGVDLTAAVGNGTAISILSSKNHAIRLDRGTQILLRVVNPVSRPPAK